MDWKEGHRRLVGSLRDEVRKNWGHIAELEDRLSLSDGYLNKLCSGRNEFKLDLFLETIGALGLDHKTFFSRALEIQPRSEDYLQQLDDAGASDRAWSKIAKATAELVDAEAPPPQAEPLDVDSQLSEIVDCPRKEQARRLRHTRRYRSHAFTRAYLDYLDRLRDDDALGAARLVTIVATELIPALPGPNSRRLSLQCSALGIFASARRLKGETTIAARSLRMAIDVARRAGLRDETAFMLRRSAYLLRDFGHFDRALSLLREALEIYVDLGDSEQVAQTSVERGMMLSGTGDYEAAILVLERALSTFDSLGADAPQFVCAAHQYLAYIHEQRDDLETAEQQLRLATEVASSLQRSSFWARLTWSRGTLAHKRGHHGEAAEYLAAAREALAENESTLQEALITVDLLAALLAQQRFAEACAEATTMARMVEPFRNNRLAEMAVVQLVRAGIEGSLSQQLLEKTRAQLVEKRTPRKGAPGVQ